MRPVASTSRAVSGLYSATYGVDKNSNITQAGSATYGYDALNERWPALYRDGAGIAPPR